MARNLAVWRRVAGVLGGANVGNSDVWLIGPRGAGTTAAIPGEHPTRLVITMGVDVSGTLSVWQGMQFADMPVAGAPTSTVLSETLFPYVAGPSMTQFVVEDIVCPFLQLRYTNGAAATTFFRLYAALHFD